MKKIILMVLSVVVVQQLAKYFGITSFEDLKNVSMKDLKEFMTPKQYSTN
ncbi:MAG: hypothetical protein V4608_14605 [Bacteroidota bacterium]